MDPRGGGESAIGVTLLLSSGMRWRRRAAVLVLVPVLALGAGYVAGHDYIRGAAFVVRAAGMQGIARTLAEWETRAVVEETLTIPWRGGVLPARRYLPRGADGAGVPARPGRPRLGRRRAPPHRVRPRPRVHGPPGRHRRPAGSRALHDFPGGDRCHRGCGGLALTAARPRARRPHRDDGDQLRRRTVDRRRRTPSARRSRRRRALARRARRPAADAALSLHGHPG